MTSQKNVSKNATAFYNLTKNSTAQTNATLLANITANKSVNATALAAKNVSQNATANASKNGTANASGNSTEKVGLISEAFHGAVNITYMMNKITDLSRSGNYSVGAGALVQMNKTSNVSLDANTTANATLNASKFTGIGSTKGQIELPQQKSQEEVDEEIDNAVYAGEKTKVVADIEKITNKIKTNGNSLLQKQSKI